MTTKVLRKNQTFSVSLSTKGQIVIPKAIRDQFAIDEHSKLLFTVDEKGFHFVKLEDDVDSVYGSLGRLMKNKPSKPITQKQFELDLEKAKDLYFKSKDPLND
ncbi:MAG: AbrB/MazE/SpoVT family DNA-binding domain-containing protein [bacterium]